MRLSLRDLTAEQQAAVTHLIDHGIVREKVGDFETTGLSRAAWPTQFSGLYRNLISGEIEPQGDIDIYIKPPDFAPPEPGAALITGQTESELEKRGAVDWRFAAWLLHKWHDRALETPDGEPFFEVEMPDGSIRRIATDRAAAKAAVAADGSQPPLSQALYTGHNLQNFDRRQDNTLQFRAMFPDWYQAGAGRSRANDTLFTARAAKLTDPEGMQTLKDPKTGRQSFRNSDLTSANGWTSIDGRSVEQMDLHNARDDILLTASNSHHLRRIAPETLRHMDENTAKNTARQALMHGEGGGDNPVRLYGYLDHQGHLSGRMVTLAGLHDDYYDGSSATVANLNAFDADVLAEIEGARRADGALDLRKLTALLERHDKTGEPLTFVVRLNRQPILLPAEAGIPGHEGNAKLPAEGGYNKDKATGQPLDRAALEKRAGYFAENPDVGAALVAARQLADLPKLRQDFPDAEAPESAAGAEAAARRIPEESILLGLQKKLWMTQGEEGERRIKRFETDERHDQALFKYFAPQDFEYEHLEDPHAAFDPDEPDYLLGYLTGQDLKKHHLFEDSAPDDTSRQALLDEIKAIRAAPETDADGNALSDKAGREDYIDLFWRLRANLIDEFRSPLLRRQALLTVGQYRGDLLSPKQQAEYKAYHAWRLNDPAAPSDRPSIPQLRRMIRAVRRGPDAEPQLFADEAMMDGRNPARDGLKRLHQQYKDDKVGSEAILKDLEKTYTRLEKAYPLTDQDLTLLGLSSREADTKPPGDGPAKNGRKRPAAAAVPG